MGKICFWETFWGENQKKASLAPLINCHDPGRTVSREPNILYTVSGSFNNAEQFSIKCLFQYVLQYYWVQQKVDKINFT